MGRVEEAREERIGRREGSSRPEPRPEVPRIMPRQSVGRSGISVGLFCLLIREGEHGS